MTMTKRWKAALVAGALLTAFSGCSDDGGDQAEDTTTTTEEEVTTTTEGDEETTTTEGDDDTDSTVGDVGDFDFGNFDDCIAFASAYGGIALSFLGLSTGAEEADIDTLLGDLEEVRGQLPGDAQDALDLVLSTFQEVGEGLAEAGIDLSDPNAITDPDVAQELVEITAPLSDPEFNEANETVTAALDELCQEAG
jgi:hypothetical protein